jgi:hypothetical protein
VHRLRSLDFWLPFYQEKGKSPSGGELFKKSFPQTLPRSMPRWHLPFNKYQVSSIKKISTIKPKIKSSLREGTTKQSLKVFSAFCHPEPVEGLSLKILRLAKR